MTVCIGALSESEQQISVVTDSKVAFGDFSSDKAAIKHEHLGNGHVALIAGNDIVYALTIIEKAKKRIRQNQIKDTDETAEILYEELCAARDRVIEAKILRRYGMTVQQFLDKGRKSFTDQVYYEICSRIDKTELSLQFLLAGFDQSLKPHLRIVSVEEPPQNFDSIGFAAIGSGAHAALASLSFASEHLGFGRYASVAETAHHLLAAKFMAESATNVGKDSFFLSVGKQGTLIIHHLGEEAVRKAWLKHGAPQISPHTTKILKDIICDPGKHLDRDVLQRCLKHGDRAKKKMYRIVLNALDRKALAESKLSTPQKSEDQS